MTTRLTDEQILSITNRLTNARRHGMSEQALLVIAEELLDEVMSLRRALSPVESPGADECPRGGRHSWAREVFDVNEDTRSTGRVKCLRCGEFRAVPAAVESPGEDDGTCDDIACEVCEPARAALAPTESLGEEGARVLPEALASLRASPCCTRCKKAGLSECQCPIALPLPYGPIDPVCHWPVPMKEREWENLRAFCDAIPDKMLAGHVRGMVSMLATSWFEVSTLRREVARLRAPAPAAADPARRTEEVARMQGYLAGIDAARARALETLRYLLGAEFLARLDADLRALSSPSGEAPERGDGEGSR